MTHPTRLQGRANRGRADAIALLVDLARAPSLGIVAGLTLRSDDPTPTGSL